jgi:hypothetical protein
MKPLLIPALVVLAQATAWADGGTVQLRQEAGDLVITVFTSPGPLSVGPVDISLLLQNRDGLEPVLDAKVSLILREDDSTLELQAQPTREQARNKLLYAAPVTLSKPGKWNILVTVLENGKETDTAGILEVAAAPDKAASYAGYIAFPPVMIGLFMVRQRLIRRRSQRGE